MILREAWELPRKITYPRWLIVGSVILVVYITTIDGGCMKESEQIFYSSLSNPEFSFLLFYQLEHRCSRFFARKGKIANTFADRFQKRCRLVARIVGFVRIRQVDDLAREEFLGPLVVEIHDFVLHRPVRETLNLRFPDSPQSPQRLVLGIAFDVCRDFDEASEFSEREFAFMPCMDRITGRRSFDLLRREIVVVFHGYLRYVSPTGLVGEQGYEPLTFKLGCHPYCKEGNTLPVGFQGSGYAPKSNCRSKTLISEKFLSGTRSTGTI